MPSRVAYILFFTTVAAVRTRKGHARHLEAPERSRSGSPSRGAQAPTAAADPAFWDFPLDPDAGIPEDRSRFLRLHAIPEQFAGRPLHGTVVMIHGGYWQNQFGLDDAYGNAGTISLAPFFLARGFGAVELEYRRRDHEGGGWRGTNEDILTALARLEALRAAAPEDAQDAQADAMRRLRPDRIVLVGHSAGGCMALWTGHQQLPAPIRVALVMAMAPVTDLVQGYVRKISAGGDAVEKYMKCTPEDCEEAYAKASPQALLPVTFPTLVAFGTRDTSVPPDLMEEYAQAALAGSPDLVRMVKVPYAGHFDVVNANRATWLNSVVPVAAEMMERALDEEAAAALLQR